ncbi:MAG TPA: V-type ATPase subunit [Alphaproteobacteria bacterium]|nr:V-type ATPase subunit [Alphaproteobacteria bacterium]
MEGDYGYANARIRAMKSWLLDARIYDALLAASGIDEVIELLVGTVYRADIEVTLVKYGGMQCVAEALRINVAHTIGKLKSFFAGRSRELAMLLLARWDIFNLMTILRGQARGVPPDEILDALMPIGQLTAVELRELAQQPSMRATVDVMLTWHLPYAKPLARALGNSDGADLWLVETRLHQWRYGEALAGLGEEENEALVKEMLQAEIDVVNVLTLLRLSRLHDRAARLQRRYGAPAVMPLLIAGGRLPDQLLQELSAARDVESIVRGLRGTPYAAVLSNRMERYRQSGDVAVLQRGLEELVVRTGVRMVYRNPLSIAIAIGYIWAKTNEVANVRVIAQGKALGLERDAIQREMIRV